MEAFQYQPLIEREIRLLQMLPSDDLACKLIHVSLDQPPRYCALSYLWGPTVFDHVISVHGHAFHITASLHEALQRFKEGFLRKERLTWVDAISINQADWKERSRQVVLMRKIYERAYEVWVWLGPAENDAENELAIHKMKELDIKLYEAREEHQGDITGAYTAISGDDPTIFDTPGSECYRAWQGIVSICNKMWWRRTWIFQEATAPNVAKDITKVSFYCGPRKFTWIHIAAAQGVAERLAHIPSLDTRCIANVQLRVDSLIGLLLEREKGEPLLLLNLLARFRISTCKDPRDKVYAPRGLAADVPDGELLPDYSKSTAAVYRDVVQSSLSTEGRELDFLGYVVRSADEAIYLAYRDVGLATWIPDWEVRISIVPFQKGVEFKSAAGSISRPKIYTAGGDLPVTASIDGWRLQVQGCCADRIVQLSPIWEDQSNDFFLKNWTPVSESDTYPTGERLVNAMLSTLLADVEFYSITDVGCDSVGRGSAVDWTLLEGRSHRAAGGEFERQRFMKHALRRAPLGRRLCYTGKGYVGLVPAAAKIDDKICVFWGGQVLYVLRERGPSEHEFIGECYVHGLMDGQVLKWLEERKISEESFRIA